MGTIHDIEIFSGIQAGYAGVYFRSEQVTNFFADIQKIIPDVIGSEFLPSEKERKNSNLRHEDVTALSFPDESLDMYISFEHVFDYERAFAEAARVLALGGVLLFHVPFYLHEKTAVRATRSANGVITLLADPVYHGNPIGNGKSLWVNDFGWDMFDCIRNAGFAEAYALFRNDSRRVFLNTSALTFVARK